MSDVVLETPAAFSVASPTRADLATDQHGYGFSSHLATLSRPEDTESEAIRGLRTHIITQHINAGRRALAVCSPEANAGCTITAVNLAVALSQVGLNTLLIDGSLSTPGVEKLIRPPAPPAGLTRRLAADDADYEAYIDHRVLPDLSIIYAGEPNSNAQELLAGERFRGLMTHCLREFDITIVDTPPANKSYDAKQIASVVGSAVLVARRNKTFIRDVKTLATQLGSDGVRIVGAIMYGA